MKHDLEIEFSNIDENDFFDPADRQITVLSGSNNCGKTVLLKLLYEKFNTDAFLCGTDRYHLTEYLPVYSEDPQKIPNLHQNLKNEFKEGRFNRDNNLMQFQEFFVELDDTARSKVFDICSELLDQKVACEFVSPGNSMSRSFLTVDGTILSKTSSGSRLLINLVSLLFYKKFIYLLIDEPELGLTPKIQNALQRFMYADENLEEHMSHLKHIYIATHSHIFLSRNKIRRNYLVTRVGKSVSVRQITSYAEFQNLQFSQLGNTFEQLHLPSGFVIVEGKTDYKFVNRLLQLRFKSNRINIIQANGDGQVKKKVHDLFEVVGDISKSPYRERVIVVLDSTHLATLPTDLENMGLDKENIIVWAQNGIEYYYPECLLRSIFEDDSMVGTDLVIQNGDVSHNGISKTKDELCEEIICRLSGSEPLGTEMENKLITKVQAFT